MPHTYITMPDSALTVRRRVNKSIVDQLIYFTNFPKHAVIVHSSENDDQPKRLSKDGKEELRTQYTDLVYVNPEENYSEDAINESLFRVGVSDPIYNDPSLGFKVWPCYTDFEVTLTLKFRAGSRTMLETWAKALMLRQKVKPLVYMFDITYDFPIPELISDFAEHLYEKRQAVEPYNQTKEEYLDSIRMKGLSVRANENDSFQIDTLMETQRGIVGGFDSSFAFNNVGAKEAKNELTANLSFKYKIPTSFRVEFPYIVHNQMIDSKYMDLWLRVNTKREPASRESEQRIVRDNIPHHDSVRNYARIGVPRPFDFDPYLPEVTYPETKSIYITPVQVDVNNPKSVMNIKTDTDNLLQEAVADYIIANPEISMEYLKSPYLIELIGINEKEFSIPINVDSEGNVNALSDLSPRNRHYLHVKALTNFARLADETVNKLLKNPLEAVQAFSALKPGILATFEPTEGNLHAPKGRRITAESYNKIVKSLPSTSSQFTKGYGRLPKTVGQYNFISGRK